MTAHGFPESDWKVFRELRDVALERFCQRVLDEIEPIRRDATATSHQRYLRVYRLIRDRDKQIALAFNDPRRSQMIVQLAAMCAQGLLEPAELSRFSEGTRTTIDWLAKESIR